ncbi:hypothetical protein BKA65DRAFT_489745 [Rhexocercosporidium sp. MPI-PUGE-AT-0058]|nr:hypothetical protein BKA65DRAFT_489745 [Rhexocercosporidium sp. MPI-PUGE-AT-0058]
MSSAEGLQIAQIIADLQTLQNADPQAALSLLTPLKSTTAPTTPSSRRNSPPKFDKLGRRIVSISRSQSNAGPGSGAGGAGFKTPTFAREGSSASTSSMNIGGSGASTPISGHAGVELDEDLARAKTLLQLFEMRGKFRQMGDTGLSRAKQRVDEVVARYAEEERAERERIARARHLGV